METCLDRLQTQMLNSNPLTNEEIVEQEVFKNAYIPKNLNEVHNCIYKNVQKNLVLNNIVMKIGC